MFYPQLSIFQTAITKTIMNYSEKLTDPRWQKKRLEILNRDKFTCQNCGDKDSTLHVHHKTYKKNREPWDYPKYYFVTLCAKCHQEETDMAEINLGILMDALRGSLFLSNDFLQLAIGVERLDFQSTHRIVASAYSNALGDPKEQAIILKRYLKKSSKPKKEVIKNQDNG